MPETPKRGLSPDFNLKSHVEVAQADLKAFDMPLAAAVAQRQFEHYQTDAKTGLLNEEAWRQLMEKSAEKLNPDEEILAYVADVDGFKRVNDVYGHDSGDELLGIIGEAFKLTFKRETDAVMHGSRDNPNPTNVARLGGDEFAVSSVVKKNDPKRSLPAHEQAVAQTTTLSDTFRQLIKGTKFDDPRLNLSLSIGWAVGKPGESGKKVAAEADLNMYKVKYQGKEDKITEHDIGRLQIIIPYFESLGARVDPWIKNLVEKTV